MSELEIYQFSLLSSVFDGSANAYFLAGCIGCLSFPVLALFFFGIAYLIVKFWAWVDYCKKRRKVVEKLYPLYEKMMKGDN